MDCAESLFRTALAAGVDVCFANAGTSEMPMVAALDAVPEMRGILCLFEGGCTGAADGYARMTGKPALTLLHAGAGVANASANLHNARRAASPIVNLIGDQPSWHGPYDPLLSSDLEAIVGWSAAWSRRAGAPEKVAGDLAATVEAAQQAPGKIASLILPLDSFWEEVAGPANAFPAPVAQTVSPETIEAVAVALRGSKSAALLLKGLVLQDRGLKAAARIKAATGCRLYCDTFVARVDRGPGLPTVERVPYFPEDGVDALADLTDLVMVGGKEPVAFFGYPGQPSQFTPPDCTRHILARPEDDGVAALEALADALGARLNPPADELPPLPPAPSGALTAESIGAAVAHVMPEGAILVDEGITASGPLYAATSGAPYHAHLIVSGGAIGWGFPGATGAAVACPDRPVIAMQADGSGMYTLQSLWTQAREGLNVTTVVYANNTYEIIKVELDRAGLTDPGPKASALADFRDKPLDWVALAKGHGVPGVRVENAEDLMTEMKKAMAEPGPHLIEALM
ncbi:MAG: acetolactate synthase large subunit [Rhodospirillales bacterium]|nr:acetolactate synthase large subunit [Rhodospirillales bacterium]